MTTSVRKQEGNETVRSANWQVALLIGAVGVIVAVSASVMVRLPATFELEIVSATSEARRNPRDFMLCCGIGATAALFLSLAAWPLAEKATSLLARPVAVWLLIISWVLGSSLCCQNWSFGAGGADAFHEGEYLGFLSSFRQDGLKACMLIHGPLANIAPAVFAGDYRDDGRSIAAARSFRTMLSVLALCGFIWTVCEIIACYGTAQRHEMLLSTMLFVMICGALLYGASMTGSGNHFRDVTFWPHVALLCRYTRLQLSEAAVAATQRVAFGYGVLCGLLHVLHLLVCYERALNAPILTAVVLAVVVVSCGVKAVSRFVIGLATGIVAATFLVGRVNLGVLMDQIAYWGKFGDAIFALPLGSLLFANDMFIVQFLLAAATTAYLVRAAVVNRSHFAAWLRATYPLLIVLVAAVLTQRRYLARCDTAHFELAGLPTALLATTTVLSLARSRDGEAPRMLAGIAACYPTLIIIALLFNTDCNPIRSLLYVLDWRGTNATKITPVARKVVEAVRRHAGENPPSLYTLDSNGTWYYLLGVRSASRFHHAWYAAPPTAQAAVIAELEAAPPPVIIGPPSDLTHDGLPAKKVLPKLFDFVRRNYEVAEVVAGYEIFVPRRQPVP